MRKFVGYWDKKLQRFVEDYPPQIEKFGTAPMVKFGNIIPMRHPATGEMIDTQSRWDQVDKEHGLVTYGTRPAPAKRRPIVSDETRRDIDQAVERATNALEWGDAPLSEQYKQRHREASASVAEVKELTGVDVTKLVQ